ncbi:MAG TPA: glycosyltransferase family 39 protein, partial [Cytophagaceae bacterium]
MNEERAQIITKTTLKIAIFLMATMAIFIFFASIVTGYEEIVTCFLRKYDKLHQIDQFKQYYLTKTRFHLIQSAIAAVIIILLFVLVKIEKVSRVVAGGVLKLWAGISDLYLDIKLTLKELPTKYKAVGLALLVISLITKLYYIAQFPLTEDEVFSYVYLVEKGLGVSAVYYPGPNNHILYSLSCVFIDIFVDNPRWIMRLPALLASLCLPLLFFYFAAKLTDRGVAFLASALSLFSAHILHYSFHGRGYIYIILFTVIALFSVILYLKARQNRWLVLSGVSSVLGFYTIPIFLYPFVSVYFYLFIVVLLKKDFKELRKVIFVIALIAFFTGL